MASLVAQRVEKSACNVGDLGSIPESGKSPGEGNGNPLQYSCLENPMDRGNQQVTVHGAAKSRTCLNNIQSKGQMNPKEDKAREVHHKAHHNQTSEN